MARHTIRNARLEARHKHRLNDIKLDAVLRNRKHESNSTLDAAVGRAVRQYEGVVAPLAIRPLRQLIAVVTERSKLFEDDRQRPQRIAAVVAIAAHAPFWLKSPDDWRPRTHNADRQLAHLLRHLFARYDVPAWMDAVWFEPPLRRNPRPMWFVHVARGGNLRKAVGLPIPLTKMMAHHATLAPGDMSVIQALRYGQAVALGVDPATTRAVLGSRLGQAFASEQQEAFWLTVLAFFARHPMIDAQQISPICDYLQAQKFGDGRHVRSENGRMRPVPPPQPGLAMTHRDPATLVTQVQTWHRQLARLRVRTGISRMTFEAMNWPASGIRGLDRLEGTSGNTRHVFVGELLSAKQLVEEGDAMRHCVATYAWSCSKSRAAIFTVQVNGERLLTAEVNLQSRTVVQVRARLNKPATAAGERIVRMWAAASVLQIGQFAFTRAW